MKSSILFGLVALLRVFSAAGLKLAGSTPSAGKDTEPVTKVVLLLQSLEERIEADRKEESKTFDKYACWCQKTSKRKADDITQAQKDLRRLSQQTLSLRGKIAVLVSEIAELTKKIKKNEEKQEDLTAIRQKENAAFLADTAEMKEALIALEKAITVLKEATKQTPPAGGSLLQQQQQEQQQRAARVSAVRAALQAFPSRVAFQQDHMSLLSEYVASSTDTGAKYAPQSATVQGILADMYATFAADLESAYETEATRNKIFEDLIATLETARLQFLEERKGKNKQRATAEEDLADTVTTYDDTERQMKADIVFFDETKAACSAKHTEWNSRDNLRTDELAGIRQAIRILTGTECADLSGQATDTSNMTCSAYMGFTESCGTRDNAQFTAYAMCCACGGGTAARDLFRRAIKPGFETFLQVASMTESFSNSNAPAARAYATLSAEALRSHSLRLAALASDLRTTKVGHFDKVIAAIDTMIKTLNSEGAADIAKRDQCKEEYKTIASVVADLNWKIDNNIATIDKLEKLIAQKTAEKVQTIKEIGEVDAQMQAMTKQREAENAAFLYAKKEDLAAIDLLNKATNALMSYYTKNNITLGRLQAGVKEITLAQKRSQQGGPEFEISQDQAPDAVFSDKGARKNEAKDIVSLLAMITEELKDEIESDTKEEAAAQAQFDRQMNAAKELRAELDRKRIHLGKLIADRESDRDDEQELQKENEAGLKDEQDYQTSIKPDCDWIIRAFAERADRRAAEMGGLVQAKEYLAGANFLKDNA